MHNRQTLWGAVQRLRSLTGTKNIEDSSCTYGRTGKYLEYAQNQRRICRCYIIEHYCKYCDICYLQYVMPWLLWPNFYCVSSGIRWPLIKRFIVCLHFNDPQMDPIINNHQPYRAVSVIVHIWRNVDGLRFSLHLFKGICVFIFHWIMPSHQHYNIIHEGQRS